MPKERGASFIEYALLIAIVVGGLIAMQLYLKRSYTGKLRADMDRVGGQFTPEGYGFYKTQTQYLNTEENTSRSGTVKTINRDWTDTWTDERIKEFSGDDKMFIK